MAKRITLSMLESLDWARNTSTVREIEMIVDGICQDAQIPAYSMQFWNDVRLYGLREAFTYLYNYVTEHCEKAWAVFQDLSKLNKRISEITG